MIRGDCITCLGQWIVKYPSYFLQDNYLKYLGWILHDKDASVRLACLTSILGLYDEKHGVDFFAQLLNFTQRFRERMLEMTRDVDVNVSLKAIQVFTLLGRWSALEQDEIDAVLRFVTDDNVSVRLGAANFVKHFLLDTVTSGKKKEDDQEKQSLQLKKLLEFIQDSPIPDLPNYVVDALWHTDASVLKVFLVFENEID